MVKNIEEKLAIAQNNQRFAIVPHYPGGIMSPDDLRHLADMAERFNVDLIKATSAQRIAFIGVDEDKIDEAWEAIGRPKGGAIGKLIRSVRLCPGNSYCPYGTQDTISMGLTLDEKFHCMETPFKLKIGVSGCTRDCAETCIKDIGLIGFKKGWRITVGGNGGPAPRLSLKLADALTTDEALEMVGEILEVYKDENPKMRIGKWISKFGLETLKERCGLV